MAARKIVSEAVREHAKATAKKHGLGPEDLEHAAETMKVLQLIDKAKPSVTKPKSRKRSPGP